MGTEFEIVWIVDRYETDPLVWVSVALIEEKWKLAVDDYIGPGGRGKAIENRYERVGMWLRKNGEIHAPIMCLDERGNPSFTDGRHRFAWVGKSVLALVRKVEAVQPDPRRHVSD